MYKHILWPYNTTRVVAT